MFIYRARLFQLFGFTVYVDVSWLLLAALITWTLAVGYFPFRHPELETALYWWMGVASAIGVLFSIVFHELAHSLVARRFDMPIRGITLFVFGGVAEMTSEPTSARGEFLMAVAGPIASFLLAILLYFGYAAGAGAGLPVSVLGVVEWLAYINLVLAVFNLIPAFPLDGGRMLRAALWGWKQDIGKATRIAATSGSIFGLVLMGLALLNVLAGNFVGGIWLFLIGLFIRGAASAAYTQTMSREAFEGRTVREFMKIDPVSVAPGASIQTLVNDYIYRHYFRTFPVISGGRLVGCVTLDHVKKANRADWPVRTVADIMDKPSERNTIAVDASALEALNRMQQGGFSKLMVLDRERLVGIVTLRDLMGFLAVRMDLDREAPAGRKPPRDIGVVTR